MQAYAEQARGAGRPWDDVAEALGIGVTEDGEPRDEQGVPPADRGPAAAADEPSWFHRPTARWTCSTCGQRITDHGPFESHPDDVEEGHAEGCARREAEIATYRDKR
jgi:hypothetical protein